MTFDEYEKAAKVFANYPETGRNMVYPALGLCSEAGEVADKLKKIMRDKGGIVTDSDREAIGKEVGDVMWYVAALCRELGLDMDYVAAQNLKKLESRAERGKIGGSGDDR